MLLIAILIYLLLAHYARLVQIRKNIFYKTPELLRYFFLGERLLVGEDF